MNEVEQMKQCLFVLRQDGPSERDGEDREEEDDNEQETAFEILSDLCENLDNARGGKNLSSSIRDFLAELQIIWAPFVPFISLHHRPDGSGWTRPLRLQVPVSWSEWTEVARRRPHSFLCTEYATSAGSLAWHWGSSEIAEAGRVRPAPHCQSKSSLCCVM